MNELELRKHAVCSACRREILHTGLPLFWTAKVERYVIDIVASAIGGDDVASPVMALVTITICETCASSPDALPIAAMVENAQQ